MSQLHFIDLDEARQVLAEMGIVFTKRQMKRAAETDHAGRRKLPFFVDPVDGKLRIDKETLRKVYFDLHAQAQANIRRTFNSIGQNL